MRVQLSLLRVLVLGLVLLGLSLGGLVALSYQSGTEAALDEARRQSAHDANEAQQAVIGFLSGADDVLKRFTQSAATGLVRPSQADSVEAFARAQMLHSPDLCEVTLTYPPGSKGVVQVAVVRQQGLQALEVVRYGARYAIQIDGRRQGFGPDPSQHPTYQALVEPDTLGRAIWSDLHFTQLDEGKTHPRVVVTAQQALLDKGRLLGVMRVGLSTERVNQAIARLADDERKYVFLCDPNGRLLTPGRPNEQPEALAEDVRYPHDQAPPALQAVLRQAGGGPGELLQAGDYWATFHPIPQSQGWLVGVAVPRSVYLGPLFATRNRLLSAGAAVAGLTLLIALWVMRLLGGDIRRIQESTRRIASFDFQGAPVQATFQELGMVLDGLELAKASLRTLGKYTPLGLIRQLFAARQEPRLGGQLQDLSIMFTDIKDFTTLAEAIAPDALARLLGKYLDVMTGCVLRSQGMVDKYIGDAVMALWNAPEPLADHCLAMCAAALDCVAATEALFQSPAWDGPPLLTRFGLHTDHAMVGHFGSPDRMSYTALGDGVNLASRLEALNKQYGTRLLASESVEKIARDKFVFRLLDRVAVKGKTRGVLVYELLGRVGEVGEDVLASARRYAEAFEEYQGQRFEEALARLGELSDPAASALTVRCRLLQSAPPGADWDGVYVSHTK